MFWEKKNKGLKEQWTFLCSENAFGNCKLKFASLVALHLKKLEL
jgi:hypothetical protein